MSKCFNCGTDIPEVNDFCTSCGAPAIHENSRNINQILRNPQKIQTQTNQNQTNIEQPLNYSVEYDKKYGDSFSGRKRNPKYNPDLSAMDIAKLAFKDMKEYKLSLKTALAIFVIGLLTSGLNVLNLIPVVGSIVLLLINISFVPMIYVGFQKYLLNNLSGKGNFFDDLFEPIKTTDLSYWFSVGLRNLLIGLATFIGMLLIIPGFCVMLNYSMFMPLLADGKNTKVAECYHKSKKLMYGKRKKLLGLLVIPGFLLSLCIGALLLTAMLVESIVFYFIVLIISIIISYCFSVVAVYFIPEFYLTQIKEFEN